MKRVLQLSGILIAVALVAGLACLLTARWTGKRHSDAHRWIHTQLGLTSKQESQLQPIEQRYDEQRRHFSEVIRIANTELGQALLADGGDSPRVKAAIAKIQEAQGQLQEATLRHVFEMKAVLRPEQYDKLLNLTANALYQVDRAH